MCNSGYSQLVLKEKLFFFCLSVFLFFHIKPYNEDIYITNSAVLRMQAHC